MLVFEYTMLIYQIMVGVLSSTWRFATVSRLTFHLCPAFVVDLSFIASFRHGRPNRLKPSG